MAAPGTRSGKSTIELTLFGQKLVLKAQAEDPDLVQRTIALVRAKVDEAQARAKSAAPHQVTLLALMDLAAEYLQAKDRTEDFKRDVNEKSERLRNWIEAELDT